MQCLDLTLVFIGEKVNYELRDHRRGMISGLLDRCPEGSFEDYGKYLVRLMVDLDCVDNTIWQSLFDLCF